MGQRLTSVLTSAAEKKIAGDYYFASATLGCLISVLVQTLIIMALWGKLPPEVPIFYSRTWGEAMLATPLYLWILPIFTIVAAVINFFLSIALLNQSIFLVRILLFSSLLIALTNLYNTFKIMTLLV